MIKKFGWKKVGVVLAVVVLVASVAAVAVNAHGRGQFGGQGFGGKMRGGSSIVALLAEESGLSVEDIHAELEAGQTLAQVAAANGVNIDALIETALAEKEAFLSEAVADGRLTQEEADAKLAEMAERLAEHVNEVIDFSQMPQGSGGGRRGGPGGGNGQPQNGQGA